MRVLYLGIDPSRYCQGEIELVHQPLIQTIPIEQLPQEVIRQWKSISHVISTSPRSADHLLSFELKMDGKTVVAIGDATGAKWRERGINPLIAKEAVQEGVAKLLQELNPSFVLYPRSSRSRPHLADFLKKKGLRYLIFELYKTVFLKPEILFSLKKFDQIVFTSPSTVEAFFLFYKTVPKWVQLKAIGPITENFLKKKLASNFFS